jgi:hypothetical protein
MACYRVYGLTASGASAWVVEKMCASDAEACHFARAVVAPEREREVWLGTVRVALTLAQPSYDFLNMPTQAEECRWLH